MFQDGGNHIRLRTTLEKNFKVSGGSLNGWWVTYLSINFAGQEKECTLSKWSPLTVKEKARRLLSFPSNETGLAKAKENSNWQNLRLLKRIAMKDFWRLTSLIAVSPRVFHPYNSVFKDHVTERNSRDLGTRTTNGVCKIYIYISFVWNITLSKPSIVAKMSELWRGLQFIS